MIEDYVPPTPEPHTFELSRIDDSFPKPSYRDGQKEAIEFALKSFNAGKKIVILECPTGSGKSAIGMTIADMVPTSYYITITKILQDQLAGDFDEKKLVNLKGRNAYPCTFYKREGQKMIDRKLWTSAQLREAVGKYPTCATGYCRTNENRNQPGASPAYCKRCMPTGGPENNGKMGGDLTELPFGKHYSACPYYETVYSAINSRKVAMNFSSFLYQTNLTKRFDCPRDLMIIDECHNIEPQLLDFVSFTVTDLHLQEHGIFIPELDNPYDYYVWLVDTKIASLLVEVIRHAEAEENMKLADDLKYTLRKFQLFMHRIEESEDDVRDTEWVSDYEEHLNNKGDISYRSVKIRPVFATAFANDLLFKYAGRILLMSATVLDVNVVCKSLGIDKSQIAAKRLRNRFPVKNRPIYLQTVAKMTGGKSAMHNWAPQLVAGVNEIMDKHEGQKGIIHTHNFAIMEHLMTRCDADARGRFLCQRDFFNKTKMLEEHEKLEDSVIIAPAMHEGVDLVDDLSRFQVICKVPFANFFDNQQLARRVEIDRRYYIWLTALKLVQMYGRSVRSEDDYATTYVLDESIYRFLRDAKTMLPIWFTEALIEVEDE